MESWIVAIFTFGFSIFYVLSLIEKSVWPIIFAGVQKEVDETDVRITHRTLKRLTPLLPPSNGVVILVGTTLLLRQAWDLGWSWEATLLPIFYLTMMLGIVLVGKNPSVVFAIRAQDESSDLAEVKKTIRLVGIHHHTALATNLLVVLFQILAIN